MFPTNLGRSLSEKYLAKQEESLTVCSETVLIVKCSLLVK